jgi:hypothetical protein
MFQIVQPNVRSRDPLRPASTNEIHMPSLSPIQTRTIKIRMLVNQEKRITEKITEIVASLAFIALPVEQR